MFNFNSQFTPTQTQIKILELLAQKSHQQKVLGQKVGIAPSTLGYNLGILEKVYLIQRKTLHQIGNVAIKEISLHPKARQKVRRMLGKNVDDYTLITGFGKDNELFQSHELPMEVCSRLKKIGYSIKNIVACITPESNVEGAQKFVEITECLSYPYNEYRNDETEFFTQLAAVIEKYNQTTNVILDTTPLTKLFTLKLLQISIKYQIPSFYLGKDAREQNRIIWTYVPEDKQVIFAEERRK
ncbi:hypothetical protein [Candidatus Lokiarchaeum ossiferum]|uniref:hypothetical protein n=1 Tax=Candidatus Lokiarchaeum ossiferum TaxID=2951803 RepID=UPI00352FDA98